MLVVDKTVWEDGETVFNISMQDSRYDHNNCTPWGKIKGAAKILFGKPVYYSDIFIDEPQKYKTFVEQMQKLANN